MKVLAVIALILLVAIVVVLVLAARKPAGFRIERATSIKAPPDKIFALINDFRNWRAWSPWERMDPNLRRSYGGAERGEGAVYEWEGNSKVGKGRMEIVEAPPPSRVAIKLDFLKPFEAHNMGEFLLEPKGDSTSVIWATYGPSPYMSKVIGTFINIDDMIGRDFEKGLADLKAAAEKK